LKAKKIITICASAAFYEHVNEIAQQLEKAGYAVLVPHNAKMMRENGDYDVSHYKTWYDNPSDFDKKRGFMKGHIKEVERGDAILVVNDTKHGKAGYIGPNVLIEMAIADYLQKQIFVLNTVDKDNNVYEEIMGMGCVQLDGDINKLKF
jgi:hypothetical protein